jgi:hypothetical protein
MYAQMEDKGYLESAATRELQEMLVQIIDNGVGDDLLQPYVWHEL